jgi:short-subunit dehydrogenase
MTKIVIVGATSTIAEACAELWAKSGNELLLVGRNSQKLEVLKNHLVIKTSNTNIETLQLDFSDERNIHLEISKISKVDIALIAHGELTDQHLAQSDPRVLAQSFFINAASAAVFLEAFALGMLVTNSGTLAVIGSVAGDRGRASNYVYGAAKGFLEKYSQGLRTRFAGTGVKVMLFKLGPTKTRMTNSMVQKGFAEPEEVAKTMVGVISKGRSGAFYIPLKWLVIMMVIRLLPTAILARLNL